MTTPNEYATSFQEGETPPAVNAAEALREKREQETAAAIGEFATEFGKEEPAESQDTK
jgi:hypothetical protein